MAYLPHSYFLISNCYVCISKVYSFYTRWGNKLDLEKVFDSIIINKVYAVYVKAK